MFSKILIANRGEIACRIIRACRKLGIASVAVYSQADSGALHVQMADEAVEIGPPPSAQSYLVAERIVAAARETGAQAVHPGYGFLSEKASFPELLAAAGIAWIGPNPAAIRAMGDKIESKKLAAAAGVSTVPGELAVIADEAAAAAAAERVGFPVMLKASAGGGGKGMRIARSVAEAAEGWRLARAEAASSFGDDRVFIERFIEEPRHIEIQVLGDTHGHVLSLHERECSIQRRNQKVIEEAPSAFLDAKTRKAMGDQAVSLAKAVGYDSAGTVEFIVDPAKNFYFLEMNTRLQVEHPVTECVTGLDLVEEMIRVAAGEKLRHRQADITLNGHAIEARIYAEDPSRGFLPSIGRLSTFHTPAEGTAGDATIRIDTGVTEGGEISVHYDPMIAKLIVHAPNRNAATDAMAAALDRFAIDGIRHNIPFLGALMANPRWRSGNISTGLIAQDYGDKFAPPPPDGDALDDFAVAAAAIDHLGNTRRRLIDQQMAGAAVQFAQLRVVRLAGTQITLRIAGTLATGLDCALLDDAGEVRRRMALSSDWWPGRRILPLRRDGEEIAFAVRPVLNGVALARGGHEIVAHSLTAREAELTLLMPERVAGAGRNALVCPMPGVVVSIAVGVGDVVTAGQPLAVVEAMKMQNTLSAERDATVKAVLTKPGDSLALDAVILEFT